MATYFTTKAMNMPTKPDIFAEIHTLIELIERAKTAGDYYLANVFFVAALHIITRGKRDLSAQTFKNFFFVEVDADLESMFYDTDSGEVGYYDLLNIRSFDAHACIPMPMLCADITIPAYQHAEKVERFDHARDTEPALPDEWSAQAYGYLRMGEEAAPLYLSESGMAEVENLRGRRVGAYTAEDGVVIDAEVETM